GIRDLIVTGVQTCALPISPVANAQVFVVGTSFGAVTNDKGYYFINNVPVGTYSLRAQFIGYAPSEVRAVRVLGGQTLTVPIKMRSEERRVGKGCGDGRAME